MHRLDAAPASWVPCTHGSHALSNSGAKQVCSRRAKSGELAAHDRPRKARSAPWGLAQQVKQGPLYLPRPGAEAGAKRAERGGQYLRTWLTACSKASEGAVADEQECGQAKLTAGGSINTSTQEQISGLTQQLCLAGEAAGCTQPMPLQCWPSFCSQDRSMVQQPQHVD